MVHFTSLDVVKHTHTHGKLASFAKRNDIHRFSKPKSNSTPAQTATLETENDFLRLDDGHSIQLGFSRSRETVSHNTTTLNKTHSSKQELHGDRQSNKDQQTEPNNIDNAPFCNKTYQPGAPSLKDNPESG